MRSAVVVGGSAGLGLALAEQLAQRGVQLVTIVGRDSARLLAAIEQIRRAAPQSNVKAVAVDITSSSGAETLATCWKTHNQPLDLLINAVGQSDRGLMLSLTPERLEELVRTNIAGPLLATQALVPLMTRGSVIVNIGSLSSYFAPQYLGGYSIAKHGLRAMTQQLRMELAEQGIHVMLACPGPVARADAGQRYAHLESARELPPEALRGGGGAKLKGLDMQRLASDILTAAERRRLEIIRPRKARLLLWLITLWPALGERVLKKMTSK